MEALDLHRAESAKLSEHQENCRLLGKNVRSAFDFLNRIHCLTYFRAVLRQLRSTVE